MYQTKRHIRAWLGAIAASTVLGLSMSIGVAQSFSPLDDFLNLTSSELTTLQGRITFLGPQEKPVQGIAFRATGAELDLGKFTPFERPGIPYGDVTNTPKTFTASLTELQAMLKGVSQISAVASGGVSLNPYVSFALVATDDGSVKGFEAVVDEGASRTLFDALRAAFASNREGLKFIDRLGCHISLLRPGVATDITSGVSVQLGGLRLNRATNRFVGVATVTNNTGAPLTGSISVVLTFAGNVTLFNSDGYTCSVAPEGRAFINLPLSGGSLAAGQSSQINLELDNPNVERVQLTSQVLAGEGSR